MKDFLPIGTVVLLKGANKKIMIIGRVQICENKAYHYSGVLYPEGFVGKDRLYVFNNDDIEQIFFKGMEGAEEEACKEILSQNLERIAEQMQQVRNKKS